MPPPGVILAGGRATRMGGGDKGLRVVAGRPLIGHVIARLGPQCGDLAINANGDPARWAGFGLPVLADGVAGQPGPLAGVLAGLDWAAARGLGAIVTAAADTPFLPADLVARLVAAAGPSGVAMAASREAGGVRPQPVFALWPVALREDLRAALAQGVTRVGEWAGRHRPGLAEFGAEPFFNVNAPGDLAEAERRGGR